jgi:integrase/recombinase XerD
MVTAQERMRIVLTIYRRHLKTCEHRDEGREYRRCKCPIWVDGVIGSRDIRQSLKMRDWQRASDKVHEWESRGRIEEDKIAEPVTVAQACARFLRDARARKLRPPTLYKYRLLLRRLRDFANSRGARCIREMDLEHVRDFRSGWSDQNLSALKKLERLRAFFRFCQDADWLPDNPAKKLKNPKVTQPPTMPFTKEQVTEILGACQAYPDRRNAARLRALVLLLRFSGLRIRDAVTLSRDRIREGKLFLYTAKTGTPVWCPIPPRVIEALDAIQDKTRYFFWTGESKPKSCVGDWQRSLRRLFKLAGVPDGHAHRFRDTFAVELLLAGVPLERVSVLLGHQSVKVTEKHYTPWVLARQEQLEQDVRRTWNAELIALTETKGTPEVHRTSRPN